MKLGVKYVASEIAAEAEFREDEIVVATEFTRRKEIAMVLDLDLPAIASDKRRWAEAIGEKTQPATRTP